MCHDTFLGEESKDNYLISKSRTFNSVGAAYKNDREKNELELHTFYYLAEHVINMDQRMHVYEHSL